jgi:hypothetical protein
MIPHFFLGTWPWSLAATPLLRCYRADCDLTLAQSVLALGTDFLVGFALDICAPALIYYFSAFNY